MTEWSFRFVKIREIRVSRFLPFDEQTEDEGGALSGLAFDVDGAAVGGGNFANQSESQPDALGLAPQFRSAPVEAFEDAFAILTGNARSLILHAKRHGS